MNKIEIVYENEEILVVNKLAGISVQGGEGIAHPLDKELSIQLGYKVFLVHRLDKETSGLLVVAKSSVAASKWISLIASKQVKKEYTAICFDYPVVNGKKSAKGVITDNVIKSGRELSANTFFEVLKNGNIELSEELGEKQTLNFSVIHLTLGTGRMHQIRIHLSKSSCPIVGDDKHGNFKFNKKSRKLFGKKMMLCSNKLTIKSADGNDIVLTIPLPDYMNKVINSIKE